MGFDIEEVLDQLPDDLDNDDVVTLCGAIITAYSENSGEAHAFARAMIEQLAQYYTGECQCDTCVAWRKKGMN